MGTQFQVYKMRRVLTIGCTTILIYSTLLNCTLKMVKMVNFMLRVFYHHFPKLLPIVNINKAGFTELLLVANLNMI